jgi:hypothetical protein
VQSAVALRAARGNPAPWREWSRNGRAAGFGKHGGVFDRMWTTIVWIFSVRAIWMTQAKSPYRGLAPGQR